VRELRAPGFVEAVAATLRETELPGERLILEVTESACMEDVELTSEVIRRLQGLGVQLAFDDFGTGYSSLSYLRRFQVNRIKIDRSFVRDMARDENTVPIIAALIAMAHRLKIAVTAEGVETEEQLALLRAQACDSAQGYLISRPVPADGLLALLRHTLAR
jgi:EAL domain-containing protein (putative c-di-GMP-specific phosphodiesterase class I)